MREVLLRTRETNGEGEPVSVPISKYVTDGFDLSTFLSKMLKPDAMLSELLDVGDTSDDTPIMFPDAWRPSTAKTPS